MVASGQTPADLHELYLTGGSSHLRLVHRKMTELLGRPPATLNDPKLVVAQGALLVPPASLEQPGPAAAAAGYIPTGTAPNSSGAPTGGVPGISTGGVPTGGVPTGPLPTGAGPIGPAPSAGSIGPVVANPGPPPASSMPTSAIPMPTGAMPRPQTPPAPTGPPGQLFTGPLPMQGPRPGAEQSGFRNFVPGAPPQPPPGYGQQPPQFPPPGSQPFPSGQSPESKPKWLIPAIAAALVAVIAIVVVIITTSGSNQAGPTDPVTNTTVQTTSDTASTETCSGSACNGGDQYQRCPNGTTVAMDATCTTEEQTSCWDGSDAASTDACPALEGEKALEWIFPVPDDWTRDCAEYTGGDKYPGEQEVFGCTVDKLTDTVMYLSRWDTSASAQAEFTAQMGDSTDFPFDKDPDGQATALQWSKEVQITEDDGTTSTKDARAIVYKDSPYSILVYYNKTEAGTASQDTWFNGQLFSSAQSIADRGPAY